MTETTKHTQKEWTCTIGSRGGNIMPGNDFNSPLKVTHTWSEYEDWGQEAAANMILMAAAPDYHAAALQLMREINGEVEGHRHEMPNTEGFCMLRAAIARATEA